MAFMLKNSTNATKKRYLLLRYGPNAAMGVAAQQV